MVRIGNYVRVIDESVLEDTTKFQNRWGDLESIMEGSRGLGFTEGMRKYCGKIYVVSGIGSNGRYFTIREIGNNKPNIPYSWAEDFVTLVPKPKFDIRYPDIDFYAFYLGRLLSSKIKKYNLTEIEAYKKCYKVANEYIDSIDYISNDFNAEKNIQSWVTTHDNIIELIFKGEDE